MGKDWHPAGGYEPIPYDPLAFTEDIPPAPAPPLHRDPCTLFVALPALAWLALALVAR